MIKYLEKHGTKISFALSGISLLISLMAYLTGFEPLYAFAAVAVAGVAVVDKYKENPAYFNQGFHKLKTNLNSSGNKMASKSGQFFLRLLPQKEQHEKWGDLIELYDFWKEDVNMGKATRYRKFITQYVSIVIGSVWQNIRAGAFKEIE